MTALHRVVRSRDVKSEKMLDATESRENSLQAVAQLLIRNGASVKDKHGRTPLHYIMRQ